MKNLFVICLCVLGLNLLGIEYDELAQMVGKTTKVKGTEYLKLRDAVVALGKPVLPLLAQAAYDANLTWQQRLLARICYEKIVRGEDIDELRHYDWWKDPNFNEEWSAFITGPVVGLGTIVSPKCSEMGLWYYYIELIWEKTGENTTCTKDYRINTEWPIWCMMAVKGQDAIKADRNGINGPLFGQPHILPQPEKYWLPLVICDRLSKAKFSDPNDKNSYLFSYLVQSKESDAVPVLVEKLDAYEKETAPSHEYDAAIEWELTNILSFADSRHVKLLEKFIADHPKLTEEKKVAVEDMEPDEEDEKVVTETRAEILKKKLDEVRKRPAPESKPEPPFRLGDKFVPIPEKEKE